MSVSNKSIYNKNKEYWKINDNNNNDNNNKNLSVATHIQYYNITKVNRAL